MKRSVLVIFLAFFVASMVPNFVFCATAQQITVDLSKMSPEDAAKILEIQQSLQKKTEVPTRQKMEEYVQWGERMGVAIAAMAKQLSIEVNEFIKTPVGKVASFVILWKFIGHDLWKIVGGTCVWIVISTIIIWSYRRFHITERIQNKETGEVSYIARYNFKSNDARCWSAWMHGVCFAAITLVCLLIVFN